MLKFKRQTLSLSIKTFDIINALFCTILAILITTEGYRFFTFQEFFSAQPKPNDIFLLLFIAATCHITFSYFGLYESKRLTKLRRNVIQIIKTTVFGSLFITIAGIIFQIEVVQPGFLLAFWLAYCTLTILSRLIARYFLKIMRLRGRNLRRMLIVGSNENAVRFLRKIEDSPELGYRVIGFIDDSWKSKTSLGDLGNNLIGGFDKIESILKESIIDELLITLPVKNFYDQTSEIVGHCEEQGIIVRLLSKTPLDLPSTKARIERFDEDIITSIFTGSIHGWPALFKRVIDIVFSFLFLIILSPVFLILAILTKLTSDGPIFFTQDRVGLNKHRFRLYKFRTMIPDAEKQIGEISHLNEAHGPVFKIEHDPRITSFGRFLRRASIDELPQLLNVLKGDMSLVGPRPLPLRDFNGFQKSWHRRRFSVRPGITGYWQVNGRSLVNFEKWMEMDMSYIDNWSLWVDFKILFLTIPAVIRGTGAA